MSLNSFIPNVHPAIARIVVDFPNGTTTCGTGFFINETQVLTCAHIFLQGDPIAEIDSESTEKEKVISSYFTKHKPKIRLELNDVRIVPQLLIPDWRYDIALLETKEKASTIIQVTSETLELGDEAFFCGFPVTLDIPDEESPFTVNTATLSAHIQASFTGTHAREFMQFSAFNLGGNSGAPIFSKENGKLIGLMNGQMNWYVEHLVQEVDKTVMRRTKIPLPVAYGTSMRFIEEKSVLSLNSESSKYQL